MLNQSVAVLLIEDDADAARLLRTLVVETEPGAEFHFTLSPSLPDALGRLFSDVFDVVLLDLALPGTSGLEGLAAIRKQAPETPVIVLCDPGDRQLAAEAVQRGAEDYLPKQTLDGDVVVRSVLYGIERFRRLQFEGESSAWAARFRTLLETLAEGVVIFDAGGRIVEMNEESAQLYGVKRADAIGKRATEHAIGVTVLTAAGEPAAYADLPTVRAFQEARAVRNRLIGIRRGNGSVVYVRANSAPLFQFITSEPDFAIVTYTDVTAEIAADRVQYE